jgi:hypothetical protein
MAEIRGRYNTVKERLMTMISLSTAVLQPKATHVSGNYNFTTNQLKVLPLVSVKTSEDINDEVFDRILEGENLEGTGVISEGSTETISFTAHVHTSACTIAGEDRGRWAQELADQIVNYLHLHRYDIANSTTYGIEDIFNLSARESDIGGFDIARIVVAGRILCKRYD